MILSQLPTSILYFKIPLKGGIPAVDKKLKLHLFSFFGHPEVYILILPGLELFLR